MIFSPKKLPSVEAPNLMMVSSAAIEPYTLMSAPLYWLLPKNRKFVAIKSPLDFFTPEELTRYQRASTQFYFSPFIQKIAPFQTAARTIRALLLWQPQIAIKEAKFKRDEEKFPQIALPTVPFELSDSILRTLGPLWNADGSVDPFFVHVWANQLCDLMPNELLVEGRDLGVSRFESAILGSSWVVLTAVLLGYLHLDFLNQFRLEAFERILSSDYPDSRYREFDEMLWMARDLFDPHPKRVVTLDVLNLLPYHSALKLHSRFNRIKNQLVDKTRAPLTTVGPGGIVDV